jgi:predicted ribosome-associated RNA-binding protein Tma20
VNFAVDFSPAVKITMTQTRGSVEDVARISLCLVVEVVLLMNVELSLFLTLKKAERTSTKVVVPSVEGGSTNHICDGSSSFC